jgi:ribosomal protein S18 acetylase RimI-like enzyme
MTTVTPSVLQLRAATPTDARMLVSLQQAIYDEGDWFVGDAPPRAETLMQKLRGLSPQSSLYLVAVLSRNGEEVLCGWLELHRLLPERLKHVAVLTLAVDKAYRRKGIARRLLNEAYRWAKRVGVEKITLNVRAGNSGAIALYKQEGFIREGCERAHIRLQTKYEDNWIMAKFFREDL